MHFAGTWKSVTYDAQAKPQVGSPPDSSESVNPTALFPLMDQHRRMLYRWILN